MATQNLLPQKENVGLLSILVVILYPLESLYTSLVELHEL